MKLLKGFGINVTFGGEIQYCIVCGEFNFGSV
jgi:hypothetical protein